MTTPPEVRAEIDRYMAAMMERTAPAQLPARGRARPSGPSTVYSFRLDPDEVAALERRAAAAGIGPTMLARNLVRIGLSTKTGDELPGALDRLAAALDDVRDLMR